MPDPPQEKKIEKVAIASDLETIPEKFKTPAPPASVPSKNPEEIFVRDPEISNLMVFSPNDFKKDSLLGEGNFSRVYKLIQTGSNDVYVLKERKDIVESRDEATYRYNLEWEIFRNVHHPNIVGFCGIIPETLGIVMEGVIYGSLDLLFKPPQSTSSQTPKNNFRKLRSTISKTPSLMAIIGRNNLETPQTNAQYHPLLDDPLFIFFIAFKILSALKYLSQRGICHLDLACRNVLLDENWNPKLCDFGCATKRDVTVKNHYQKGTKNSQPKVSSSDLYNHKGNLYMKQYLKNGVASPTIDKGNDFYETEVGSVPVKWCAPELFVENSRKTQIIHESTDSWGWACLIYELCARGDLYSKKNKEEVKQLLLKLEYKPPAPDSMNGNGPLSHLMFLYEIMVKDCWVDHEERKTPTELYDQLRGYVQFV